MYVKEVTLRLINRCWKILGGKAASFSPEDVTRRRRRRRRRTENGDDRPETHRTDDNFAGRRANYDIYSGRATQSIYGEAFSDCPPGGRVKIRKIFRPDVELYIIRRSRFSFLASLDSQNFSRREHVHTSLPSPATLRSTARGLHFPTTTTTTTLRRCYTLENRGENEKSPRMSGAATGGVKRAILASRNTSLQRKRSSRGRRIASTVFRLSSLSNLSTIEDPSPILRDIFECDLEYLRGLRSRC